MQVIRFLIKGFKMDKKTHLRESHWIKGPML